MARNQFTFVNHASFMVQTDAAVLLVDPWLEGSAFNQGWSLLDRSTSNAALVAQLNEAALPVFIWISHEHPDHFSISFIKLLQAEARVRVTFLYQQTLDGRVAGFLRKQGFAVIECAPGAPVTLGHDMRIAVFPYSEGDSWALIQSGGRSLLNLNDCVVNTPDQCREVQAQVAALAPRIDVLLTQFGYANWVGNPDQPERQQQAAAEKITRMALQIGMLKPGLILPFASFVYFSQPDNAYLNAAQNTPRRIADATRLAKMARSIRFLQPGASFDLDSASAASLTDTHRRALAHWSALLAGDLLLLPATAAASLDEVRAAFEGYRAAVTRSLHHLPQLLELAHRIAPLDVALSDLQQTVRCSYRKGLRVLDAGAAHHVSMTASNAVFLFRNEYGFDTTQVNGRFQAADAAALAAFSRFFLPQRMAKNGYDRRHPRATLRYLVRRARAA
ncbi:MBL fold metallo-hydrolase [Massilia sp. S19_KUP03_FR1]|uniref:MBL fold metallo-hydrolase n=1 Tax=Massilia sp. S19_KUP03_FR1 TaxID=3025503 RepID=UPI002FCD1041